MENNIWNDVLERIRVERLIDIKVKNFKNSSAYKNFTKSSATSYTLEIDYVDNDGYSVKTRVNISKVYENKNSCMNKTEKYRKLQKRIEAE